MKTYRLVWEIDIEADSATEAAIIARNIQLDNVSTATVFDVYDGNIFVETIDLIG
jgi:hypothetical protein